MRWPPCPGLARSLLCLLVATAAGCTGLPPAPTAAGCPPGSWMVRGATLVDGTGAPARRADVRVENGLVVAVEPSLEPGPCDTVVEATGLTLAPGFIDSHSHADDQLLDHRDAVAAVSQGITTVVVGQDGGSPYPLADFVRRLAAGGAAVNVASYAGHGTLRQQVLGGDFRRPALPAEVAAMAERLETEMESGALGLATGLEYDPGIYSTTDELVALARVAAAWGGRYISHLRSEDRRFWEAVDEIVTIGREADLPVQISHLKLAMRSSHGETERLRRAVETARAAGVELTADLYPYTYWQSSLTVLFPERDFADPAAARFAVTEVSVPEEMLIPRFLPDPAVEGRTLAEVAAARGTDPALTLSALIAEAQAYQQSRGEEDVESVIAVSMAEEDVETMMRWPWVSFCTDGELVGSHPRGRGSFPRILGRYVRERGVLGLEEAVRKMTSLPAASLGLGERGVVAPGRPADLVLFDPVTVADRATTDDPLALSMGIVEVWVAGEPVYERGAPTGRRPGRFLLRGGRPAGS